jgi:membrane protein involved in colicin uptake
VRRNLHWPLVALVGVALALAWAIPSMGASTAAVARKAFARANVAFHNANLAIDTSNTAKTTANSANTTANAAKTTANAAQSTANTANSTANTALNVANAAAHVQDNFTHTSDPSSITGGSCTNDTFSRSGVLSTDEVIVTPPGTQPLGIVTQAYTSSGSITLEFCNVTGSPIDPPSGAYEFSTIN